MNLYEEFCQQLERMRSERKLLIEPDFMKGERTEPEGKKRDTLSPRETKQSKKKQTKPLIEVISKNPTNVDDIEEPEEPPVGPEEPVMDAALKDRILKCISAPKNEEQMARAKQSAEKLMRISRSAMAAGKSLLREPCPTACNKQRVSH